MKKRVAVLMGGWSAEREVSLSSGQECATALAKSGYSVRAIDVTRDLAALTKALRWRPDAVFNALHGRGGEDGTVQGVLEFLAIPYTHSGVLASAVAMDKPMAKAVFARAGLPLAEGLVVKRESLPGREITVAVMDDRALGALEIRPRGTFYDYTAKYATGGSDHLMPAPIHPRAYEQALDIALRAHRALGCRGVSRADLRYDDTAGEPGRMILLEVNTQPGMTPTSLVPDIARHAGIDFAALVSWMVEHAACDA